MVWVTIAANRAMKMMIIETKHNISFIKFPFPFPSASYIDCNTMESFSCSASNNYITSLREGRKGSKLKRKVKKCLILMSNASG